MNFTTFVVSTDGLLGREAKYLLMKMSVLLSDKWNKDYSEVFALLKGRISLAILRGTHSCIHGSRDIDNFSSKITTNKTFSCDDGNFLSQMIDYNEVDLTPNSDSLFSNEDNLILSDNSNKYVGKGQLDVGGMDSFGSSNVDINFDLVGFSSSGKDGLFDLLEN